MKPNTLRSKHEARWAHKREECVKALRAGYSVGAIARAREVPETAVRHWQKQAGIPAYTGKPRPMPSPAIF